MIINNSFSILKINNINTNTNLNNSVKEKNVIYDNENNIIGKVVKKDINSSRLKEKTNFRDENFDIEEKIKIKTLNR